MDNCEQSTFRDTYENEKNAVVKQPAQHPIDLFHKVPIDIDQHTSRNFKI